jgi:hypothetical protein
MGCQRLSGQGATALLDELLKKMSAGKSVSWISLEALIFQRRARGFGRTEHRQYGDY